MASRRRSQKRFLKLDVGSLAGLAGLWLCLKIASNVSADGLIALFGAVFIAGAGFILFSRRREARLDRKLKDEVNRHENGLISYFHQTRSKDHFGNLDETTARTR